MKVRVYEIARELKITNKELLYHIESMDISVKSHMSAIDIEIATKIKKSILGENGISNQQNQAAQETLRLQIESSGSRDRMNMDQKGKNTTTQTKSESQSKVIKIKDGETGHTYKGLFGEYLKGANSIIIKDPYLRKKFQIRNFSKLCALILKIGDAKKLHLVSKYSENYEKDLMVKMFDKIRDELEDKNIDFTYEFDSNLHDRQIELDNGYFIQLGRGLDIYKFPEEWTAIAANDPEFRPCYQHTITIVKKQ